MKLHIIEAFSQCYLVQCEQPKECFTLCEKCYCVFTSTILYAQL